MTRRLTTYVLLSAALGLPLSAQASDWDKYKGDCDSAMEQAASVHLQKLKECVGLWIAYVDPDAVPASRKEVLTKAFQALYDRSFNKGDEEGEYLARSAADRASMRLAFRVKEDKPVAAERPAAPQAATAEPKREKFVPPPVSAADRRRADGLVKKGIGYFKRGKREAAKSSYEQALLHDPGNLDGLFNLAAEHAHRKDGKASVEQLQKLQDIGTEQALKRLQAARVDPDFVPIRDYVPYKRVTGYARIKVVNSLGEFGEDEVDRIVKTLDKLKHKVDDVGVDKKQGREAPVIWFKDHSAATAYLMKKVVIHPGTLLTRIHWDTPYDVIVSWGNKVVKRDGVKQPAKDYTDVSPDKAEERLDDLAREENRILREPEKVARKVDHTIDTPKRVTNKVEGGINRAEQTVDKIEKTGKKIEGIFK